MAIQLDQFGQDVLNRYVEAVGNYNAQVTKAKSIQTREEFVNYFLENDPRLEEINNELNILNEKLDALEDERMELAAPFIDDAYAKEVASSGIDPEALKLLRSNVNAAAKYLTSMYGDEALEGTPKLEGLRTNAAGGSSGGRRIRGVEVYIDNVLSNRVNAQGVKKSTFSIAAADLEVETVDLQRAFFAAAGSEDVKAENFPTITEFDFADKEGAAHKIRVVKVDDSADE